MLRCPSLTSISVISQTAATLFTLTRSTAGESTSPIITTAGSETPGCTAEVSEDTGLRIKPSTS